MKSDKREPITMGQTWMLNEADLKRTMKLMFDKDGNWREGFEFSCPIAKKFRQGELDRKIGFLESALNKLGINTDSGDLTFGRLKK